MKSRFKKLALVIVAFNLALVLLSVVLSWHSTIKHPMQGRLVAAGEHQLHVIESPSINNTGPAVVLIHGASTSALDFSTNLQTSLSERWHVISIDRPGHGYSDRGDTATSADPARQAEAILDALHTVGIVDTVLIGHSWAGSVVMAALLQKHEHINIRAGILIAGATHPWEGGSARHVELSAKPVIGTVFRWQYIEPMGRALLSAAVEDVFSPDKVPEGYINNTGLTLSLRPATYKHNAQDVTRLSNYLQTQSARYPQITQPLLSIAASQDHVVPAWNHHERLLKQIPHMQSLEIPDAGHAPHHTRTKLVTDTIESFLLSLD